MIPGAKFHHIGIACRSFNLEQRQLEFLGYKQESPDVHDAAQRVHVRFLVGGGPRLELVRGDGRPGPLSSWLKSGFKMYHMAYEVDCIEEAIERLVGGGAKLLMSPVPASAFAGRRIAFVMLPNMILVEIIEK
jgi:methylmalonyl-CoA/ethylmalonyl-CoA epimerase